MTFAYVPLPWNGRTAYVEGSHGNRDTYPLDTSGRRGAPLAWACRNADDAATLARIFAGEIDASPARRRFVAGDDPDGDAVKLCAVCGVAPARPRNAVCDPCRYKRDKALRDERRAAKPVLPVLWHPDTDAPISPEAARRVALKARRRALAAWMAGEGSIPPHIAAVADKAERRTA